MLELTAPSFFALLDHPGDRQKIPNCAWMGNPRFAVVGEGLLGGRGSFPQISVHALAGESLGELELQAANTGAVRFHTRESIAEAS